MKLRDCQEVAEATDLQTFELRLVGLAHQLEFGIISGFLLVESSGRPPTGLYIGNTPDAFEADFKCSPLRKRDPVLRRLRRLAGPFVYDQSTYVRADAGDLWELQARHGYKTGIAVAMHLPKDELFVLGVDREAALPRDELALTRMIADFHLLAVHAQMAVQRLADLRPDGAVRPVLTKREIEILKWTSEGKSSWAVARILSISENTVNFHVQRVLTKLAVSSRHQAAVKATSLGLI